MLLKLGKVLDLTTVQNAHIGFNRSEAEIYHLYDTFQCYESNSGIEFRFSVDNTGAILMPVSLIRPQHTSVGRKLLDQINALKQLSYESLINSDILGISIISVFNVRYSASRKEKDKIAIDYHVRRCTYYYNNSNYHHDGSEPISNINLSEFSSDLISTIEIGKLYRYIRPGVCWNSEFDHRTVEIPNHGQ